MNPTKLDQVPSKSSRRLAILVAALLLIVSLPAVSLSSVPRRHPRKAWVVEGLSPQVLELALRAAAAAKRKGIGKGKTLGIIDYSLSSTKKRFWVLDLERKKVLSYTLVAHGKGSGGEFARDFSNKRKSNKSSLGLFLTGSTYQGENGYSLRLHGLEPGINDAAWARKIVIHGAWYVSQNMIDRQHRLGRSWGCPALEKSLTEPVIDSLKEGNLIFAYFPDERWLSNSRFLTKGR